MEAFCSEEGGPRASVRLAVSLSIDFAAKMIIFELSAALRSECFSTLRHGEYSNTGEITVHDKTAEVFSQPIAKLA